MSKKIFAFLLVAVFVLAQFGTASAAVVTATESIEALPTFHDDPSAVTINWSVTGMPATGNQYVYIWMKATPSAITDWSNSASRCYMAFNATGLTSATGTYDWYLPSDADDDQDVVEFLVTVDDQATCATPPAVPAADTASLVSTFIDDEYLDGIYVNKPDVNGDWWADASCNTFEMYSLMSDSLNLSAGEGFSGFKGWNQSITGTFVPPAPVGSEVAELAWAFTFPPTASGNWVLTFAPEDQVGNEWSPTDFYNDTPTTDELEDCVTFTDVAGHANELYIRYLADLELIAGNPDGSFGPDNTLTRAEGAVFLEKINGEDGTTLPATPPSAACTFTDVTATDWFAGWVWAACADGFMNGVGGGMFDPSNLLTRGQVVTIFNNIYNMGGGTDGFLDFANSQTNLEDNFGSTWVREGAWTDVALGAYYAEGVINAYGVGIADGTSATTFSPDQAALRGEFMKMLYRALMTY